MRSWWNADRADFLITSGVWNMTSIQELFLLGLSFSQAGLWISRTSRKRQVSGDPSGNCKNGEHSRAVNRSLWIVFFRFIQRLHGTQRSGLPKKQHIWLIKTEIDLWEGIPKSFYRNTLIGIEFFLWLW